MNLHAILIASRYRLLSERPVRRKPTGGGGGRGSGEISLAEEDKAAGVCATPRIRGIPACTTDLHSSLDLFRVYRASERVRKWTRELEFRRQSARFPAIAGARKTSIPALTFREMGTVEFRTRSPGNSKNSRLRTPSIFMGVQRADNYKHVRHRPVPFFHAC